LYFPRSAGVNRPLRLGFYLDRAKLFSFAVVK